MDIIRLIEWRKKRKVFFKKLHCVLSSIYSKTFLLLDFYWENVTHNLGKKMSSNEHSICKKKPIKKCKQKCIFNLDLENIKCNVKKLL